MDAETLDPKTVEAMNSVFGDAPTEEPTPPATPPAAPATPPEEPKTPPTDRSATRIAAAMRAESRAAKARKEIEDQRADIERQRAEFTKASELAKSFEAAKASPSKLLELTGLDAKRFIESLATETEPVAQARADIQKTQTETEKLRSEIEALRKERDTERETQRAREIESATMAAQTAFVEHVATNHVKYPTLVEELTPEEIGAEALRIAEKYAQKYTEETGEEFTDDVLADYLESQAKARRERRTSFLGKFRPAPAGDHGLQPMKAQDSSQGPRTLTSRIAGEKASPPKPWSQESADEQSLQILKGATAA